MFFWVVLMHSSVDMYTKLSASRAYVYAVARACDAGMISRRVSGLYQSILAAVVGRILDL